jgi:hypothetical protein
MEAHIVASPASYGSAVKYVAQTWVSNVACIGISIEYAKGRTMSHATTRIEMGGYSQQIDTAILPLLELINRITNIQTFTCCAGYFDRSDDLFPLGYVMFSPDNARQTKRALRFLNYMFQFVSDRWRKSSDSDVEFYFHIELGDGYAMRWGEGMYPHVLEAAHETAKRMASSF